MDIEEMDKRLEIALNKGYLQERDDGTFTVVIIDNNRDAKWELIGDFSGHGCMFWHNIMGLPGFGKGNSFIPTYCIECWKVVARPRTLKEMYQVIDAQKKLPWLSKSGIEVRPIVFGNYGSYWYTRSKEEGLQCYRDIRAAMDEISSEIPVLLKRSCTEYEIGHGPSNEWEMPEGQVECEDYLKSKVEVVNVLEHSEKSKAKVRENWTKFAYERGDITYLEFNDGKPMYPPYITYQE